MDVWDLIELVKTNDLTGLQQALGTGLDPNLACKYTAMTALLSACETDNFAAVKLLIEAGADPNCLHADGYNCYDSSKARDIKQYLVEHGFSRVLPAPGLAEAGYPVFTESALSLELRVLSTTETISHTWCQQMMRAGHEFKLEYKLYDFPPISGELLIRVEPDIKQVRLFGPAPQHASESVSLDTDARLELAIQAAGFRGEARIRLYDTQVLAYDLAGLVTGPWPD